MDGHFGYRAGCNTRGYDVTFDGPRFTLSQTGTSTAMACSPEEDAREAEFAAFLVNPTVYTSASHSGHFFLSTGQERAGNAVELEANA